MQNKRLPTIETPRLTLRWLDESDLPSLFEIFSNPEVTRYWSSPALEDLAAAGKLLEHIHQSFAAGSLYQWGVLQRDTNRVIGTCTLASISTEHKRAELGYALGREHWGHGYMTEVLPILLRYAFGSMGLHRIEADVDPRNTRSIRSLERLGFRLEGNLRERYHVNGELQDTALFGLLRGDALFPLD